MYLKDVLFYGPTLSLKGCSEEERRIYHERYSQTIKLLHLIQILYNYYLPNAYNTGHQIRRFAIHLEETGASRIAYMGFVADYFQPFDNAYLETLPAFEKKQYLLDLFQTGIRAICQWYACSLQPFEEVYQTIQAKEIVLAEVYRKPKWSPNRQYLARLHAFRSENEAEVSVLIEDKLGQFVQKIKVSDRDFRDFDAISWQTNDTLNVSYTNRIGAYTRKETGEDYFEVSLTGNVKFVPVTREWLFRHALELLAAGEENREEALSLLKRAEQAGHGKASNVLTHLAIHPQERDFAKLTQMQKKDSLTKEK